MKLIIKHFFIFFLLTWSVGSVLIAQTPSKRQFIEAAEKEYSNKNYYGALVYYDEALLYDLNDKKVLFKSAEAARLFNSYIKASEKYQYLVDSLNDDEHPAAVFWLGNMKQHMGKYDEARKYYNMYLSEYGNIDTFYTERTKKELASIDYAKSLSENYKKNIKFEKLGDDINTPASEVGGMFFNEELYFSSMKFKENQPLSLPARDISKILKKKQDSTVLVLDGYINNRDQLVSNTSISPDGKSIYYSVCNYVIGSDVRCEIYKSTIDPSGNFSDELKLPDPINLPQSTSTHPHITVDKVTGKEILYFVSDRAGGKGGLDIWYSLIDPKFGYSQPINIKEINTIQNEITPFLNNKNNFLYFSSDGREGVGGFDVFKTAKTNDSFGSIVNAGIPVNSSYHDIYYSENEDGKLAFLSSNREGAYFLDSYYQSCCYDIYKMEIIPLDLDLNALTFDKLTGRPLKNATVTLIDQDSGVELATFKNDDGNDHKFPISEDRNYLIIANRENYNPDTIRFSTLGIDQSESIIKKMYLSTDMMLLDVFTYTKIGKLPLPGTEVTLIDMTNPSAKKLIEVNLLSHEYNFMLDRGKIYKIIGRKDGYTETEDTVDTRPYDKPGLITKDLFLDKFVLQDLLPITLFFDNDLPDVASRSTATKAQYGDLQSKYIDRKAEYKTRFTKPLSPKEKENVNNIYETFFEGSVKGGYDQFKLFITNLLHELEVGNKVELVLKGYASPLADSRYNLALGQRRVNSVKNEMLFYGDAQLKQYFLSGQLVVADISFGKELSPPDVISDVKDERNSIYSLKAAKERRVEILRASRNNSIK